MAVGGVVKVAPPDAVVRFREGEIPLDDPLRAEIPEALRDYADLYALELADGQVIAVTDEYGTCHWAKLGWPTNAIESLLLNEDGSWRE